MGILQHDAQGPAQVCFFDLIDIDAVVPDFSVLNVVKTVDQVGDGRLSGAGGADESDLLSRFCVHINVVQHDFVLGVAKVHIVKHHVSGELLIIRRIGILMIMLPRPGAGALLRLGEHAVLLFGIDQRHIALIGLRLLIQQAEHTLRTGQRHDHAVELHAHLVDGHIDTLVKSQEAGQTAQGEAPDTV